MKAETPSPNQTIPHVGNQEYRVMAMPSTALNTEVGKIDEPEIGKGIDYLSHIV